MTFSVSRRVTASAEDVWALLTDTTRWPDWGPSITAVEPATAGITAASGSPAGRLPLGSRGTVRTVLGVKLPYTVTALEPGRFWAWSVAGIPATGHCVVPQDGGCRVTFTVPWWAPAYLPVCALALRRIERLAIQ